MDQHGFCSSAGLQSARDLSWILGKLLRRGALRPKGWFAADCRAIASTIVPQLVPPRLSVCVRNVSLRGQLGPPMSAAVKSQLSQFALDVAEGLSGPGQKKIPPRYFYDHLGSSLFEAITLLPEYGLTRADERLLCRYAGQIATKTGPLSIVAELGSGNGKKTRRILDALLQENNTVIYRPIDLSCAALETCQRELGDICEIKSVCGDWMEGLEQIARERKHEDRLLLLFLGSSIGNLERVCIVEFLRSLRVYLRPGDFFLLGADLVNDIDAVLAAYDDPTGVTAAFNLNVLGRINRELDADFDLRSFMHEVRWNHQERRIEMHLLSSGNQSVHIRALDRIFHFRAGETIWTESSHKFTEEELMGYARSSGFQPLATWTDREWPFAETLWRVA
jgi:L-histidine Nalpha-methyltransferase